ncbi:phosphatidylserine decarboxylase [Clostridium magnum]|uniref:Phosphatidylserine decarboxylase proenzyme n=1 Tax=Clostridium magnum DSM 2767 TaxID=1121326 RepID=A0A162QDB8_9CLOT|nr:phosphatidylserine decarboxylase [Clostridium magnum]KZL88423.1 phosphatidylserine decarboxylase proenzyme [Clostridium magnum DSM 2767]SHJ26701.1 phosphatidylserine decarboxylase [Clostridium magnum DSM 2767]
MVKFYNRETKEYETEQIAGDTYLNWTYSSPVGMRLLELIIKKKLFSKLYGYYCDSKRSQKKIASFIKNFNIDMSHSEKSLERFESFNDFFTRKLVKAARPINNILETLISPGDGRLLAYENIDLNKLVQVKGYTYSLNKLIDEPNIVSKFSEGTCLILRLCPTDYHRFHFIDNGTCEDSKKIKGDYYSVNPIALKKVPELFCKNKREWSIFHSNNFGDVLHIEVGATCVGSIIQTYTPGNTIKKGDEKGYFKFGGSTTILFFQKGKVKIDDDIIEQTNKGYETKILMGEKIGEKKY